MSQGKLHSITDPNSTHRRQESFADASVSAAHGLGPQTLALLQVLHGQLLCAVLGKQVPVVASVFCGPVCAKLTCTNMVNSCLFLISNSWGCYAIKCNHQGLTHPKARTGSIYRLHGSPMHLLQNSGKWRQLHRSCSRWTRQGRGKRLCLQTLHRTGIQALSASHSRCF